MWEFFLENFQISPVQYINICNDQYAIGQGVLLNLIKQHEFINNLDLYRIEKV